MTVKRDLHTLNGNLAGWERNNVLARWERAGKIEVRTNLGGWTANGSRRLKTCKVYIHDREVVRWDGRLPFPSEEDFAKVALAVMALV